MAINDRPTAALEDRAGLLLGSPLAVFADLADLADFGGGEVFGGCRRFGVLFPPDDAGVDDVFGVRSDFIYYSMKRETGASNFGIDPSADGVYRAKSIVQSETLRFAI